MIRENWDTPTRRIILELLEHTEELATYFQAVRTAIKLVDQAKGPGEGRRAKVDELLQALRANKHRGGTKKQRFGFARLVLMKTDVADE